MTDLPLPQLSVRGLRSAHGGPFDLHIDRGECVSLMGPSGAGKTLFLRLVADLDPGVGEVRLNGRERDTWTAPQWRSQVVYQTAEPVWWAPKVAAHFPRPMLDAMRLLQPLLGLPNATLDADVDRLSTGERQRIALLRSLAREPKVLLLDEPTASLDATSTMAMESLLQKYVDQGLSVLWVTHSRDQAHRVAQRHYTVVDRQLRAS
jgi:ABC-type iron transport system FetAB ATPase subunit